MSETIIPLGVTINALRINNAKITPALFQQFEVGDFLQDIGWPGFLYGIEEYFKTPFTILGRHTYKVADQSQHKVPFLYCVNNEIKKATLIDMEIESNELLRQVKCKALAKTKKLSDVAKIIGKDIKRGLEQLASNNLLGSEFSKSTEAFYDWQPQFNASDSNTVAFSPIHKKMLLDYGEASCAIIPYSWDEDDSGNKSEEKKAKAIAAAEASINQAKLDVLVQRWFI